MDQVKGSSRVLSPDADAAGLADPALELTGEVVRFDSRVGFASAGRVPAARTPSGRVTTNVLAVSVSPAETSSTTELGSAEPSIEVGDIGGDLDGRRAASTLASRNRHEIGTAGPQYRRAA